MGRDQQQRIMMYKDLHSTAMWSGVPQLSLSFILSDTRQTRKTGHHEAPYLP